MKLKELYADLYNSKKAFNELLEIIEKRKHDRSRELMEMDKRPKDWYLSEKTAGMMLYVDLFSEDLKHLKDKIPYLKELGITFVHLMPLLKSRPGENDGGYAVEDYLDIEQKLGTLDDFVEAINEFRHSGIDVCIDFVLNHTSDTHEWAKKASKGVKKYMAMYEMYDDRTLPDQFDETVSYVLPMKCPGNFSYHKKLKKWIFTSFSEFQWDLNFRNPRVFNEMVDILLHLANYGVNIIRLDAIAFMWKTVGTSCRNLPEVHKILEMIHLIKERVCPSVALLGEAIVEPEEIVKYFGKENIECSLLYNANLMVNVFHTFATRDTRLLATDQTKFKAPSYGGFINYIRCHDDIGWGMNEDALNSMGMNPIMHKQFLNDFYSSKFKGSFSIGEIYQYNPNTGDARINGTLASLLGLEKSILEKNGPGIRESIQRILLAHSVLFFEQGIPLIYSGDELGMLNDHSYLEDDHKKYEGRWLHRNRINWEYAEDRHKDGSISHAIFSHLKQMLEIRKTKKIFRGTVSNKVIETGNDHVYLTLKQHNGDYILGLFNFSEQNQYIDSSHFNFSKMKGRHRDLITEKQVVIGDEIRLYPYEFLWLTPDLKTSV